MRNIDIARAKEKHIAFVNMYFNDLLQPHQKEIAKINAQRKAHLDNIEKHFPEEPTQ